MILVDGYGDWEERGWECEIWKEKRENYYKWVSFERLRLRLCEWNDLGFWVSIYIKGIVNWFFTFGTDFSMSSEWVHISLLPVPYSCFKIGESIYTYAFNTPYFITYEPLQLRTEVALHIPCITTSSVRGWSSREIVFISLCS